MVSGGANLLNDPIRSRGSLAAQAAIFLLLILPLVYPNLIVTASAAYNDRFIPLTLQAWAAFVLLYLLQVFIAFWLSAALVRFLCTYGRRHWLQARLGTCLFLTLAAAAMLGLNLTPRASYGRSYSEFDAGWPLAVGWYSKEESPGIAWYLLALGLNVIPCETILILCYIGWEHLLPALRRGLGTASAGEFEASRPIEPPVPFLAGDKMPLPLESTLKPVQPSRRERIVCGIPMVALFAFLALAAVWIGPLHNDLSRFGIEWPLLTRLAFFWYTFAEEHSVALIAVAAGCSLVYWDWIARDRERMRIFRLVTLVLLFLTIFGVCFAIIMPWMRNHCVVRGARVRTRKGSVPIEELAVGDEILTLSPDGVKQPGRITRIEPGRVTEFLRLTLADGRTLCVTEQHPLALEGEWVRAARLREGDRVRTEDGYAAIERIEKVAEGALVYDLTVEPNPNFFADGVLVHNALKKK